MEAARSFISTALWFIAAGILFSMPGLAYLAVIPIVVLAVGLLMDSPSEISIERKYPRTSLRVGEETPVRVHLRVGRGFGLVMVRDPLPEQFALVKGSNVRIFFKGPKKLDVEYEYTIKPGKRGRYLLRRSEVVGYHVFGLKPSQWGVYGDDTEVVVLPLISLPKRTRTPVTRSKIPIPLTSVSIRGPSSTDFREIRDYRTGDPVRFINWKASARKGEILVNEFEKEGKKTVLFIIDATGSPVGSSIENPLEYSIQLVSSLAYYFTKRGYNVGLYVMGYGRLIMPSTGSKQLYTMVRTLLELEKLEMSEEDFAHAIGTLRYVLIKYTPLVVYVSNLLPEQLKWLKEGMKQLRSIYRSMKLPMLIFDVSTYSLLDEQVSSLILLEKRGIHTDIFGLGAYPILWDPSREGITSVITRTVRLIR